MSVLRLEANIYTTGAIETIIERLEVEDYQLFIAYLGGRKSDYEKPIENIAKGVDEYYNIKLKPHKEKAQNKINELSSMYSALENMIKEQSSNEVESDELIKAEIKNILKRDRGLQSEQIQENYKHNITNSFKQKKYDEKLDKLCEYDINNSFFKELISSDSGELYFSRDNLEIIFYAGGFSALRIRGRNNDFDNGVYSFYLKGKLKPNIEDMIMINENKESSNALINKAVRQISHNARYC